MVGSNVSHRHSVIWIRKITEVNIMLEVERQTELGRVYTLTVSDAVIYANQLSSRLKCDDCSDEERKNAIDLLWRLTERVRFLKITVETGHFYTSGNKQDCT
jgi:hypothetical protein